jgi:NAD(P)-dependent dehydrogenase (short-subunit alcohol dehydrogenase family)
MIEVKRHFLVSKLCFQTCNLYATPSGTLDALFNNGAYGMGCAAEDVPVAALREIFEVNFFGWHDLTARCIKVMVGLALFTRVMHQNTG